MNTRSESPSKARGSGHGSCYRSSAPTRTSNYPGSTSGAAARPCELAEAAYFRAERRGFEPGHEISDWLQAEADLLGVRRERQ